MKWDTKALGDEKVLTMNKMKEFRKDVNLMDWERKCMEEQKYDLEEHYTDLHMLRVTRSLQDRIKGVSSSASATDFATQTEAELV